MNLAQRIIGSLDRYALLLFGVVVSFVVFKIQFLNLPYYWDEAWVYAAAIREMYNSGISMLPDAMEPRFSRGHPLMFHFLGAIWMNVFGDSQVAMHSYVLTISVALVCLTYVVGTEVASKPVGLVASAWLVLNEKFLAQSGILLPEVLLALFMLATVWAYLKHWSLLYVFFGTCALLTKESGVVIILAILTWHLLNGLLDDKRSHFRKVFKEILVLLLPIFLIAFYFLYQRHLFGWLFFPLHTGFIELDPGMIHHHWLIGLNDVFLPHTIQWFSVFLMLICPIFLADRQLSLKNAIVIMGLFILGALFLYSDMIQDQPERLLILLFVAPLSYLYLSYSVYKMNWTWARFSFLAIIFVFGFLLFSSMNFFANRYLVCLIPFVAILSAAIIHTTFKHYHFSIFPLVSLAFLSTLFLTIGKSDNIGDCELSYSDSVRINERLIGYFEDEEMYDELIYAHFLPMQYMTHPYIGYLKHNEPFTRIQVKPEESRYAVFTSDLKDEYYGQLKSEGWITIVEFDQGNVHGEILKNPNEPLERQSE